MNSCLKCKAYYPTVLSRCPQCHNEMHKLKDIFKRQPISLAFDLEGDCFVVANDGSIWILTPQVDTKWKLCQHMSNFPQGPLGEYTDD